METLSEEGFCLTWNAIYHSYPQHIFIQVMLKTNNAGKYWPHNTSFAC